MVAGGGPPAAPVSSEFRILFSDIIGVNFWCDEEAGLTSSGVTRITFVALLCSGVEGAPRGACRLVVITAAPCFSDRENMARLFNVPSLKTKIASSSVALQAQPSLRARALAAAWLLLWDSEAVEPFPDANAEAASVADELGQGWQSFPACDHMALTKGLERAKASFDASVDRNEAAPLGSFLFEYTGAFGADPDVEAGRIRVAVCPTRWCLVVAFRQALAWSCGFLFCSALVTLTPLVRCICGA